MISIDLKEHSDAFNPERGGLNGLDHTSEEALWVSFPYLRRRSTLSASLLNSPQSGTFHYLSTFLHIHSIGLHRGKEGGRKGRREGLSAGEGQGSRGRRVTEQEQENRGNVS